MAKMREEIAPLQVSHLGQFPSATVSFNLAPGAALGDAVDAIKQAQIDIGQPLGVITSFQGAALAFQSSLSNQLFLILAAIVTVYIVLGVLYESFIHPLTILSTLPSAGIGALLALMAAGDDLTIVAIIGIILLIGIVKKNAIMMIDFALDAERNEGKPPREAIYQACLLRFRPILMTTMAAVLGALPLMVGTGAGSELRHPLGISIVGGLLVSQLLTLFTTPVIYLWFDRLAVRFAGPPARRPAPTKRGELSHGPVNPLHSPAGRNDAADLWAGGGGRGGVFQAAGVAAAAGRFPDHLGAGDAARREPAGRRDHGRKPAGAPSRPDRRCHRDDIIEHGRLTRITLQFGLNRDINGAARDVQAAINAARADLPTSLRSNPTYRKVNPADAPILILTLTSDTLTRGDLYDAASTVLAQKLSQVEGIGEVVVGGSSLPAVRVDLIPQALYKYGIGLEDVRAALSSANAHSPKGGIDVGDQRYQIYANDQANKADDYKSLIVAYRNGAAVHLSDVGEVTDGVENLRNAGLANGKPAVLIILYRQPGANIISTVDG